MRDASKDTALNGVWIAGPSDEARLVHWAEAHPRPEWSNPEHWAAARPEEAF